MKLLRTFHDKSKRKPHAILFYRDGVSEGQFQQVLQHEYRALRQVGSVEGGRSIATGATIMRTMPWHGLVREGGHMHTERHVMAVCARHIQKPSYHCHLNCRARFSPIVLLTRVVLNLQWPTFFTASTCWAGITGV